MVKVVKGIENKIPVKVVSLIDYNGFSAELEVNGIVKSVPNLAVKSPSVTFSASEIESFNEEAFGKFTVFNQKGEVHIIYKIYFVVVDKQDEVQQFLPIRIVIVGSFNYDGINSASDEVITKKVETAVEKAMDESVGEKVVETVDAIIDDKVEQSISGIIDPKIDSAVDSAVAEAIDAQVVGIIDDKVEQRVDAVIDTKVETVVNELFDSSDSDTVGGMVSGLQDKVNNNLEPRVTAIEDDLETDVHPRLSNVEEIIERKIELDYDDSDDNIYFSKGNSDDADASDAI